ncbi:MAG: C40 family peptidase [Crocinitomicaceae bacterium]|nr:C40 family peptidase [Crocinitomicaceae bacterium]
MKKLILSSLIALSSFFSFSNESDTLCVTYNLRDSITSYAQNFIGTPYLWGGESTKGFDCSGFVLYVFKKFGIKLPHSSAAMGNLVQQKEKDCAESGDIILFKGTQSSTIGHVGIVFENKSENLIFIHASSSRGGGVKISQLSDGYYTQRFVKVVDVLS